MDRISIFCPIPLIMLVLFVWDTTIFVTGTMGTSLYRSIISSVSPLFNYVNIMNIPNYNKTFFFLGDKLTMTCGSCSFSLMNSIEYKQMGSEITPDVVHLKKEC